MVALEASTGTTVAAASVRTQHPHQAEEMAIALAIQDPKCTTVMCDSKTAVRNYAVNAVYSRAVRLFEKLDLQHRPIKI